MNALEDLVSALTWLALFVGAVLDADLVASLSAWWLSGPSGRTPRGGKA